ncbi:MAG: Sec-independent protein translocase protein TatB [Methyloceanibacter sp.]|uniref:Sec-independent protein translocase protein TatB n=1 Tax=Methyloceanibacter sp. TaxID=1965321 RepID=UPI003D9B414B
MFDIGWSELLVIAVVAIVVVGPKELPRLLRTFGHYAGKLKRAASDFQRQFDDAMRESELDEMRNTFEEMRAGGSSIDLNAPFDQPLMLPKELAAPASEPVPKPARRAASRRAAAFKRNAAVKTASNGKTVPKTKQAKAKSAPRKPRKPTERTP